MASLRDIAKQAGVSLSTVSRVINGYSNVHEETRQKVLRVVHDLNYSYEYVAHRSRKNVMIGVIMPRDIGTNITLHPNVHAVIMGIVAQCGEEQVLNSLILTDENDIHSEMLFKHPMNAYILIDTTQKEEDRLIPLLQARHFPFVVINRWMDHRFISYVNVDDYGAMLDATLRMIRKGHHSLGFANGSRELRHSVYRQDGFISACRQQGIPVHEEWILYDSYDESGGYRIARRLAEMTSRPTLMMTSSDTIAIGLIKGLQERGFRVPRDISVVGYGDVAMSAYSHPALTTVRMPAQAMGAEAVKSCMKLLENPLIHHIKLAMDCELVERESTCSLL